MGIDCGRLIKLFEAAKDLRGQLDESVASFLASNNLQRKDKLEKFSDIFAVRRVLLTNIEHLGEKLAPIIIQTKNFIMASGEEPIETPIEINIVNEAKLTRVFYERHGIKIPENFEERAREIWAKNFKAIEKEMATYGYDSVLIIPDDLPSLEELHEKMAAAFTTTAFSKEFSVSEPFGKVKDLNISSNRFRIILLHGTQKIKNNPLLAQTKDKTPAELTGLQTHQIEEAIAKRGKLKIQLPLKGVRFGRSKDAANSDLSADVMTLAEYLIFQRLFMEERGVFLGSDGVGTWTLGTALNNRLTNIGYSVVGGFIDISSQFPNEQGHNVGCRICKSFS